MIFFNLAKNSYHQQNQIRANSAAFQVLMQLNQPGRQAPTMSEMALQLGITKQQLTKLINDLEEKNLVRRQHSSRNRRHVYLMITPEGASIMKQLREAMLECTVSRLSSYNQGGTGGAGRLPDTFKLLVGEIRGRGGYSILRGFS